MKKDIKNTIYNIADDFTDELVKEEEKYIGLQKDVARELKKHKESEELRKVQHQETLNNLKLIEEKTIQAKIRHDGATDHLQVETEKYNKLNGDVAKIKKESALDRDEAKTLKNMVSEQLSKNVAIHKGYEGKLRFLKEDENNIEERRKKVSIREREAGIKERANKKAEVQIAENNISIQERKDRIKATEQRLKIKEGAVNA